MSLLAVEGLSRAFGGLQAVRGVSFGVEPGEMLGLIGPNGAGKTTLFNLLSGFLRPDQGGVRFGGEELVGLRPHEICRRGMVRTFQIPRPFGRLTVLENVLVGALEREAHRRHALRKAEEVLALTGLADRAAALGQGLTLPDRKRLEVARGLATEPRLLLLDEVMSGLNPTETEQFMGLVRAIHARGITVILIEHVMKAVMALSQRVLVLNHGELIAEGSPAAVVRDPKVVEAYLGQGYAELEAC